MTNITIRPAAREDLLETVHVYLECIRGDYSFKPRAYLDGLTVEDNLAECESWLFAGGQPNQIFVALDGEQVAGYIAVGPNLGEPKDHEGEIGGFFIRRAYRKQGIGYALLKTGLEYLRGLGYRKVALYNYRASEANQYYHTLGGEPVWFEIQHPGGMALETDVFGWEIDRFLEILAERIAKHRVPPHLQGSGAPDARPSGGQERAAGA
jgi:GNAT superfamily N-acetyltransferase